MIISANKGRGNKVHIMLDGEYLLTVDSDFWLMGTLRSGDDIDNEQLELFKEQAAYRRAYNRALDLISRREHSKRELITKLTQRCCDKQTALSISERLEEIGLIDDRRYAQALLREYGEYKKMGETRIKQEMLKRGVPSDIISDALEEFEDDPQKKIKELIESKYINSLADEKGKNRAINALLRRGFSFYDIKQVLDSFCIDNEQSYD